MTEVTRRKGLKPGFKIILGFLAIITVGALLLHIPQATVSNKSIPLVDCFFTSFSAVCVTGLSVFSPGLTLSIYGQTILIILIQLGGLGFMTAASTIFLILGKKFTLKDRLAISSSFGEEGVTGIIRLMKNAVIITFVTEGIGAILFSFRFIPMFGAVKGIWLSVFHAISAFCNAGFDILPSSDSLCAFFGDPLIILTVSFLIIVGGIGFLVILEFGKKIKCAVNKKRTLFSLHTKTVLIVTAVLLVLGTLLFAAFEWNNPKTIGNMSFGNKLLNAFFQSVTTRTAGFASFSQGEMTPASKLVCMLLMIIGASPAGTGGGFKTTTLAVMFCLFKSVITSKSNVTMFKRSVSKETINKALSLILMVVSAILLFSCAIFAIEGSSFKSDDVLYEVCSAIGTVGLSCGITSSLSAASKIILMLSMFFGRVGILSILTGLSDQFNKNNGDLMYPEGKILIG